MDFHSLTRRELQTLCKKNKIPANITNVAMADALKALEIVEGIEELLEPSQSETAHSSIESPTRSEVTSPYVPPTGGRTTHRRNVAKEEPVTANPMTRSRRTTRKALTKDANEAQAEAIETLSRKKVQMASACRKMDSQLKECVEEAKKDVLMASRRRGVKEESAVKRVYSTRRSARLSEKNDEGLNEVENEESQLFKKALHTKDNGENEKMNLKEALDDVDEVSEITGIDAITTMEENSENEGQTEVVSAQEQDISIGNDTKSGSNAEEEACTDFETEAKLDEEKCDKTEDPCGEDIKSGSNAEEEACIDFVTEEKLDEKKCDKTEEPCGEKMVMALNVSNDAHQSAENTEQVNTKKDAEPEDKAADCVENVVEIKDDELSCATRFPDEVEKESSKDKDTEDVPDLTVTMEKFTELKLQQATKEVPEADSDSIPQLNKDEPDIIDILQLEEHDKAADPVPSEAAPYDEAAASMKSSPIKQQGGVEGTEGVSLHSARKTSITLKSTIVFSDNKENITMKVGKNADNLNELSVRKLTKMLKEKLEITKKSSRKDHDKEVLSRPALQALPENRLVDETQN